MTHRSWWSPVTINNDNSWLWRSPVTSKLLSSKNSVQWLIDDVINTGDDVIINTGDDVINIAQIGSITVRSSKSECTVHYDVIAMTHNQISPFFKLIKSKKSDFDPNFEVAQLKSLRPNFGVAQLKSHFDIRPDSDWPNSIYNNQPN